MRAALEVVRPGLCTTVQDLGRPGFQRYGVPVSGPMDEWGLRAANALVGNAPADAVLEVTGVGPVLRIRGEVLLAVAGAEFALDLDGQPVPPFAAVRARDGQVLTFAECRSGVRAYLAVAGGIDVPLVMRSRSTCLSGRYGGLEGRPLREGDVLPIGCASSPPASDSASAVAPPASDSASAVAPAPAASRRAIEGRFLPRRLWPRRTSPLEVRVVAGPQDDLFTAEGIAAFLNSEYRVTHHADRMGYRLDGPRIAHRRGADIVSDATAPGAIQVPGDGRPIVLMGDRQTTGGYTKIAAVIRPDIPALAQARAGDRVRFRRVSLAEAHTALAAFVAELRELEAAVSSPPPRAAFHLEVDGVRRPVAVEETSGGFRVVVEGRGYTVSLAEAGADASGPGRVRCPVPGVVAQVHVAPGAAVAPGTPLVTLLAMKLQHEVTAAVAGTVAAVRVAPGQEVQAGDIVAEITPASP